MPKTTIRMADKKLLPSNRARQLVAPLLGPTDSPFKDYLRATDYCTAVMIYTELDDDREYLAQWRAAFAALMVAASDAERERLLTRLRSDYKDGRSPLPTLIASRH